MRAFAIYSLIANGRRFFNNDVVRKVLLTGLSAIATKFAETDIPVVQA